MGNTVVNYAELTDLESKAFFGGIGDTCGVAIKMSPEATQCLNHLMPSLHCKCFPTQWGFSKKAPLEYYPGGMIK